MCLRVIRLCWPNNICCAKVPRQCATVQDHLHFREARNLRYLCCVTVVSRLAERGNLFWESICLSWNLSKIDYTSLMFLKTYYFVQTYIVIHRSRPLSISKKKYWCSHFSSSPVFLHLLYGDKLI